MKEPKMDISANIDKSAGQTIPVIGFGRRLVASLIDMLVVGFFTFILVVALSFVILLVDIFTAYKYPDREIPVDTMTLWLGLILSVIYFVGYWAKSGQTIGKTMMGIRIVGADGATISWGKALLRYVGYIISGLVLSLGFLWLAFDRKRQGWHDKIAGTYVLQADEDRFTGSDGVELVPTDQGKGWIWLVLWFVVALVMPAGLFSSLLILGPAMRRIVSNILNSLF
jgi:uncharacterized RDD family membrane protein YckC